MSKPIPIKGKDGKFAGSIGTGKTDIPTAQDGIIKFEREILTDALDRMGTHEKGIVTLDELQTAYLREMSARETRAQEEEEKQQRKAAQAAFWAAYVPAVGDTLPPTYESHQHLAIGTVITIENSTVLGGYWNGQTYVKTGNATWALLTGRQPLEVKEEQAFQAVTERRNNISPCPTIENGEWRIISLLPNTPAASRNRTEKTP